MVTSKLLPVWSFAVVLLAGLMLPTTGQNLPADILQQYRKADGLYQRALEVAAKDESSEEEADELNAAAKQEFRNLLSVLPTRGFDSIRFFILFKSGEIAHYFGAPDTALHYYRQSIGLQGKIPVADSFFFKPNLYAGIICYSKSQFDAARRHLQAAEKIKGAYRQKLEEEERLYNNLGVLLYETGNFIQARNYFEKAGSVLERSHPFYENLFVNYRINVAAIHIKLQQHEAARKIYIDLLGYGIHTSEILHNTGLSYLQSGPGRYLAGGHSVFHFPGAQPAGNNVPNPTAAAA